MSSEQENDSVQADEAGAGNSIMAGRTPIVVLVSLIIVSLLAICGLGYFLLRPEGDETAGSTPSSGEPTPFPVSGGGAVGSNDAIVMGISGSTTVSVTLDSPAELSLGGKSFTVSSQTINPDASWSPGVSDDNSAGWVHGSIVNYIMALNGSDQNRAVLDSLAPGSQIGMVTEGGGQFLFEFEQKRLLPTEDRTIFQQNAPGITLVMLDESNGQNLVVNGRYIINESNSGNQGSSVELGEPTQLGDLQITVTGATYVPNSPQAPSGFAFFLVDFRVQNVGLTAVDVNNLQLVLVDEIGNQYALNPIASQVGNNPALTGGFLNAGGSLDASVGYQIPAGLVSNVLQWVVIDRTTGARTQVHIPFTGDNAAQFSTITLQSVQISTDGNNMSLTGQIINQGNQPVVVTPSDVSLRTADGAAYQLLSANPPFVWTAPPGQTTQYSVTYQRPNLDTAVFTILNQPFQLNNIR